VNNPGSELPGSGYYPPMNSGLVYLLRMGAVGKLRYLRRRLRGVKGFFIVAVVLIVLFVILAPYLVSMFGPENVERGRAGAESMHRWAPSLLLVLVLVGAFSGRGLYFKPNEVDFLFPAPVSRRELLFYNILGKLGTLLPTYLCMCLFFLRHAPHWFYGLVGIFLALAFAQLFTQIAGLLLASASVRVARRLRHTLLLGLGALLAIGVFLARQRLPADADFGAVARDVVESSAVEALTLPTRVYVEVFLAETAGGFLIWATAGSGILALIIVLMVFLDVAYLEGALELSRKVEARLKKMRTGGGAFGSLSSAKARFSIPMFPRLRGAGSLAWRQCVEMSRNLRGFVLLFVFLGIVLVPYFLTARRVPADIGNADRFPMAIIFVIFFTILMTQNFPFDFRRDLDRMGYLKSLPLTPLAIAAGQLVPTTVVFSLLQGCAVTVVQLAGNPMPVAIYLSILAFLVPLNWLAAAIDNALFLLLPYRLAPKADASFRFAGRATITVFLKLLALAVTLGLCFFFGFSAWTIFGGSLVTGGLAAAACILVACFVFTWLVARSFQAFNVGKDAPG